ncbi:hypothetical protein B6U74_00870 [Candidatus Bathyarchaeota archaeon ex4484_205]|nr:MAG: hypothetical protein B6U74_00870 [Candidatus Bathyarchaeota archaeon ex4484_205]RLG69337.1 MAG: hypothetical protein DRN93_00420 [archaeon]
MLNLPRIVVGKFLSTIKLSPSVFSYTDTSPTTVEISPENLLIVTKNKRCSVFGILKVEPPSRGLKNSPPLEFQMIYRKYQDLFTSLHKLGINVIYLYAISPSKRESLPNSIQFLMVSASGSHKLKKQLQVQVLHDLGRTTSALLSAFPELKTSQLNYIDLYRVLYRLMNNLEISLPLPSNISPSNIPSFLFHLQSPLKVVSMPLPSPEIGFGELALGEVFYMNNRVGPFRLRLSDLSRHMCILGVTGSGKSNTGKVLVRELVSQNIPVLILDWHGEYKDVSDNSRFSYLIAGEKGPRGLHISPLKPFKLMDAAEHISLVTGIFEEVYTLTPPQSYTLRVVLSDLISSTDDPTLEELISYIESSPASLRISSRESRLALLRRLTPLVEGQTARIFSSGNPATIEELLRGYIAVDLSYLKDLNTRTLVALFLLKMVYEYKLSQGGNTPLHVTIIEEASNILPYRRPEMPKSIGERMISELRKYGESVVLISQLPTDTSQAAIKNSCVKIFHRIGGKEEIRIISGLLGLPENEISPLSNLPTGYAVVKIDSISTPFLVHFYNITNLKPTS